jgi:hypothetical protein
MAKTANKKYARYNFQLGALLDAVEGADGNTVTPSIFDAVKAIELKVGGTK